MVWTHNDDTLVAKKRNTLRGLVILIFFIK
jgi:hypothetical protein